MFGNALVKRKNSPTGATTGAIAAVKHPPGSR